MQGGLLLSQVDRLLVAALHGAKRRIQTQQRMFQERALPDLDNNIKWGNSLIGSDFYNNQQIALHNEEERYRINVFDWETNFLQVFTGSNPGFDVVTGNPPYIRMELFKPFKQ